MPETVEDLVTKHTRRELEELALKLGIDSLGGTKAQLAETIVEAMKKASQKEPVKAAAPVSAVPPANFEVGKVSMQKEPTKEPVKEIPAAEKPKEIPAAEKPKIIVPEKPKEKPKPSFGTRGVYS